jgi:hypothetical protein
MIDKTYNGWTNYATWRVNLEMFDGGYDGEYDGMEADDFKLLAIQFLEADGTAGLAFDYAMAFIDEVNWHEIAEAHKEEAES